LTRFCVNDQDGKVHVAVAVNVHADDYDNELTRSP